MTWADPSSEVHILETATQTLGLLHSQAAPACGQEPLNQGLAWATFLGFLSSRSCRIRLVLCTSEAGPPLVSWAIVLHWRSADGVRLRVRV